MAAKEKFSREQIEGALRSSGANYTVAAKMLEKAYTRKCCANTISNYVKRYKTLQAVEREVKFELKDIAEAKLVENIRAGHPASIFFFLKTQAKDRGYTERAEVTGAGGGPVVTATVNLPGKTKNADAWVQKVSNER